MSLFKIDMLFILYLITVYMSLNLTIQVVAVVVRCSDIVYSSKIGC